VKADAEDVLLSQAHLSAPRKLRIRKYAEQEK